MKAYYGLVDDVAKSQVWEKKIEEDLGQSLAAMVTTFDESTRDALVANSALFQRFVNKILIMECYIGHGEAKVL